MSEYRWPVFRALAAGQQLAVILAAHDTEWQVSANLIAMLIHMGVVWLHHRHNMRAIDEVRQ